MNLISIILAVAMISPLPPTPLSAPRAPSSTAQQPRVTIYVSKLGNNTDGSSWANAFTTIQAALNAVPDDRGGCRIAIRPDTYFEAMLYPAHQGAAGAYNELTGDTDGSLGSGTAGRVIIDSGDPGQKGFKSYDWWGTIRSYSKGWSKEHTEETFSAIGWDRWRWRNLYVTGGDAGIFFDLTDQVKPFSVVVEDCVGIGRAFGGGVGNCLSRPEEPITFRRCHLWALDWWGDTAGAYVRVENPAMPREPDAVFEDCVMAGPQCALKSSNYGFHTYSNIKLVRCRLIALNFSQPQGTPTDGIIQSVEEGKLLHVDLEDCTLMGYKVFGVKVKKETAGEISCTTRGDVKAYVQYQQEMPKGFHRLGAWPADVFQAILPPEPKTTSRFTDRQLVRRDLCEISPFVRKGKLCYLESIRPAAWGKPADHYLLIREAESGKELARTAQGYGLACLLLHKDVFYIFASRLDGGHWRDVTMFKSTDLARWESKVVIEGENEEIFNSSVCRGKDGFVMAYESNDPAYPPFTTKFARSADLERWEKMPDAMFGTNRYTACPCIRYADGWYYVLYLEHRTPRWAFETYITRSSDLRRWELSAANPVLRAEGLDEGINASDPDIVEFQGRTLLYFCASDQLSWMNIKRVIYHGPMAEFLQSWFKSPGIPDWGTPAEQNPRRQPGL
jgi:hypothetical protein